MSLLMAGAATTAETRSSQSAYIWVTRVTFSLGHVGHQVKLKKSLGL